MFSPLFMRHLPSGGYETVNFADPTFLCHHPLHNRIRRSATRRILTIIFRRVPCPNNNCNFNYLMTHYCMHWRRLFRCMSIRFLTHWTLKFIKTLGAFRLWMDVAVLSNQSQSGTVWVFSAAVLILMKLMIPLELFTPFSFSNFY